MASRPRTSVDVMFLLILFEYLLGILIELLMLVESQVGQDDEAVLDRTRINCASERRVPVGDDIGVIVSQPLSI